MLNTGMSTSIESSESWHGEVDIRDGRVAGAVDAVRGRGRDIIADDESVIGVE